MYSHYAPNSVARGIINWCAVSVCPSVCRVPRSNSRTERQDGTYLEVKGLKIKVTDPINPVTRWYPIARVTHMNLCRRQKVKVTGSQSVKALLLAAATRYVHVYAEGG